MSKIVLAVLAINLGCDKLGVGIKFEINNGLIKKKRKKRLLLTGRLSRTLVPEYTTANPP